MPPPKEPPPPPRPRLVEPFALLDDTPSSGTPPPLPDAAARARADFPRSGELERQITGLRVELAYFHDWLTRAGPAGAELSGNGPAGALSARHADRAHSALRVTGLALAGALLVVLGALCAQRWPAFGDLVRHLPG